MIALLSLGTCITVLQAQTVSTVTLGGKQYPVVDLTELTPLGSVLTKKQCDERRAAMYASVPNLSSPISGNMHDEGWNKKISSKFQIMKADYNNGATYNWVNAWNICKTYNGTSDGGGSQAGQWRLPTEKEYKMILVVYPLLLKQKIISAFNNSYFWCSTEYTETFGWVINLNGYVISRDKSTDTYMVRCIRDL